MSLRTASWIPRILTRYPARHIPAIFFVLGAELPSQRGFLIEHDEQSDAEDDCEGDRKGDQVCLPKDDPQADPSGDETEVHRVPHVPVKAHDNQLLRRNHRCGRAVSGPPEIPYAAERHCEPEDRG